MLSSTTVHNMRSPQAKTSLTIEQKVKKTVHPSPCMITRSALQNSNGSVIRPIPPKLENILVDVLKADGTGVTGTTTAEQESVTAGTLHCTAGSLTKIPVVTPCPALPTRPVIGRINSSGMFECWTKLLRGLYLIRTAFRLESI